VIPLGRCVTGDETATRNLAEALAQHVAPGDVLALVGPLGSGKTRFAQGFARGLGVPADVAVTSPTFTLLAIYERARLALHHFDLYRLETQADLDRIGADEFLWGEGVCVVEWADRVPGALPEDALWITFSVGETEHELAFASNDPRWEMIVAVALENH
jgi:tRNA threonylcarbamoyladenosine biosynthesis protein TsaE